MSPTEQTSPDGLVAGPELDRLVAEAAGIEWLSGADYGHFLGTVRRVDNPDGEPSVKTWSPSTDWNDAMLAAEKTNLLTAWGVFNPSHGLWTVGYTDNEYGNTWEAVAETGPLAICRAILKVKHG